MRLMRSMMLLVSDVLMRMLVVMRCRVLVPGPRGTVVATVHAQLLVHPMGTGVRIAITASTALKMVRPRGMIGTGAG